MRFEHDRRHSVRFVCVLICIYTLVNEVKQIDDAVIRSTGDRKHYPRPEPTQESGARFSWSLGIAPAPLTARRNTGV
jgi:hypothetical protein